jgi:hypothetical protein
MCEDTNFDQTDLVPLVANVSVSFKKPLYNFPFVCFFFGCQVMISGPRPVLLGHLAKVGGYFLGWVYIIYICIHFGSVKSNDFIPAITLRLWVIKVIFPGGYYSVTLPSNSIQSSNLISFVTSRYPTNRYAWSKTLTHTHTDDAQHNMIIYIL